MPVLSVTGANDMGHGARQHKESQEDTEAGKDEDFQQVQAAALQRANSQKVVVPTPSRKNMKEIDVRKLTKSQRNMVLDQALQVLRIYIKIKLVWQLSMLPPAPGSSERC